MVKKKINKDAINYGLFLISAIAITLVCYIVFGKLDLIIEQLEWVLLPIV